MVEFCQQLTILNANGYFFLKFNVSNMSRKFHQTWKVNANKTKSYVVAFRLLQWVMVVTRRRVWLSTGHVVRCQILLEIVTWFWVSQCNPVNHRQKWHHSSLEMLWFTGVCNISIMCVCFSLALTYLLDLVCGPRITENSVSLMTAFKQGRFQISAT